MRAVVALGLGCLLGLLAGYVAFGLISSGPRQAGNPSATIENAGVVLSVNPDGTLLQIRVTPPLTDAVGMRLVVHRGSQAPTSRVYVTTALVVQEHGDSLHAVVLPEMTLHRPAPGDLVDVIRK